jgi:predicted 3-demethylubiquinone-9 3-methyltransferase (glyoxalase superfamily)
LILQALIPLDAGRKAPLWWISASSLEPSGRIIKRAGDLARKIKKRGDKLSMLVWQMSEYDLRLTISQEENGLMPPKQKITTFLWFDNNAEEAINHYISIFRNSRIVSVTRNIEGGPGPKGTVLTATFEIEGQQFMALNGGPMFKFTEAISLFVNCETQEEVDELWEKLSAGGKKDRCGWLKDKFGLSWQIIPSALGEMLQDKDPVRAKRVVDAMLRMDRIDVNLLQQAYDRR